MVKFILSSILNNSDFIYNDIFWKYYKGKLESLYDDVISAVDDIFINVMLTL